MLKAAVLATPGGIFAGNPLGVPVNIIGASMVDSKINDIVAEANRAFHRPTVSGTLFPSDKFADSVATGYHTTYPIPRTAVNDLLIWSHSECLALSSGTPIRLSRVTSSGITPSYPMSSSIVLFGGTS